MLANTLRRAVATVLAKIATRCSKDVRIVRAVSELCMQQVMTKMLSFTDLQGAPPIPLWMLLLLLLLLLLLPAAAVGVGAAAAGCCCCCQCSVAALCLSVSVSVSAPVPVLVSRVSVYPAHDCFVLYIVWVGGRETCGLAL